MERHGVQRAQFTLITTQRYSIVCIFREPCHGPSIVRKLSTINSNDNNEQSLRSSLTRGEYRWKVSGYYPGLSIRTPNRRPRPHVPSPCSTTLWSTSTTTVGSVPRFSGPLRSRLKFPVGVPGPTTETPVSTSVFPDVRLLWSIESG